jgi:hypothetical protein
VVRSVFVVEVSARFWQSSCDAPVHPYRSASPRLDRGAEGAATEHLAEPEYEGVVVA